VENTCDQGNQPQGSIKYCTTGSFSRRAKMHVVSISHSQAMKARAGISCVYSIAH
jgi:hypothetical protein